MPQVDKYLDTWRAFEKILADGRSRAIGVSNFQPAHLKRVIDQGGTVPAVNQIELHPQLSQSLSRAFHTDHGIATEAWSPLGQGKGLLDDATLGEVARKHNKTPAQVVLRWHLQLGNIAIPKSVTPARIVENFDIFDFELDRSDLDTLARLNSDTRLGADPDTMNFVG